MQSLLGLGRGRGRALMLVAALGVAPSCSRILGVDGEYELRQDAIEGGAGFSPPVPPAPPPPPPSSPVADGAAAEPDGATGGLPAPVGFPDAAPPRDAGAEPAPEAAPPTVPPDATAPEPACTVCPFTCTAVTYRGVVEGRHKLGEGLLDWWVTLRADLEISIELAAGSAERPRFRGTLLRVAPSPAALATLRGRLEGTLDCASGRLEAQIVSGSREATFIAPVTGTFSGVLAPDGSLTGTWSEQETNPSLNGNGTWSATHVTTQP
jgi:hypothetical protein